MNYYVPGQARDVKFFLILGKVTVIPFADWESNAQQSKESNLCQS